MAGQTLSEIRGLLAAAGLSPRRRFGQNFLFDLNLMRKALGAAEVGPRDVVLEVGPGTGSLTELLLEAGCRVIAVELDRGLAKLLRERCASHERLTLIEGDALARKHALNPQIIDALVRAEPDADGVRKLVANLPYQIATPLVMNLLRSTPPVPLMVFTIQREVAERFDAPPRSAAYGPVSVIAQTLARIDRVAELPAAVFWPKPKVDSIMLRMRRIPDARIPVDDLPGFVELVRTVFGQRRKMLRKTLRRWCDVDVDVDEISTSAGLSPDARPAELSVQDWHALHRALPPSSAQQAGSGK